MYRMRVQAIVVETAEVIGTRTINIKYDPTLTGLLGRINPADQWKYQWLYLGISVGYNLTVREPEEYMKAINWDDYGDNGLPFGFSVYAMVQPFDLFGLTLDVSGNMYSGPNILLEPTLIISPSIFEIDLFFGPGLNMIFAELAFSGGVRGGVHIGPGVLFADVRFTGVLFNYDNEYTGEYGGSIGLSTIFSLGYKIGFIPRKQ
jgi:hypothetical protein